MFDGGGGSRLAEARAHRSAYLETLQAVDVGALDAGQLGAWIKLQAETLDLAELQRARFVAEFDRRQACLELGSTSTIDWLRSETRVSGVTADKQLTLARQLPELTPTLEAVEQGQIGIEHALAIARETQDLPEGAQEELLVAAQRSDPRDLREVGRRIRHRESPEDLERRAERQFEKRRLRLYELADGMLGVDAALPAPEGMKLRLCLESLAGVPSKGDRRTLEQRQADALGKLCGFAIGGGRLPRTGGRQPQLTVIIREDGSAELEGAGLISDGTLKRLREQDHVERRQKVGAGGVTLSFGRARRLYSAAQRQEMLTRHPTCVVEGCTVPLRRCEAHHEKPWKDQGETDVRQALPLCWKHHPLVTEGRYRLVARADGAYALERNRSG